MHRAVAPFVVLAKQHLSPLAEPISGVICFMFRSSKRFLPETGASATDTGPDVGTK
jgi:hypothetical protein